MAQSSDFPLRKPPGFHYDFFLLGVTTFIAGLLGVPAPNGLIPQAPIHTTSLLVMGHQPNTEEEQDRTALQSQVNFFNVEMRGRHDTKRETPIGVVEQRVSNLAQGALCLVLLTGPFLHVLGLVPRGMIYLVQPLCHFRMSV
jgi:boron transporter